MCTRMKLYNIIKTLKILLWENFLQIIIMCYDTIWTLLLQHYSNSTSNSKIRKYFFLVPQFLDFIPQFSIISTQTVINIQFSSCWKVEVSSVKIFQIVFDTRCVLEISSAGKFHNGSVAVFTQLMTHFYFVPRNIYINMVQNSAGSGF